jgi:ComEC/Rec2-related protein
LSKVVYFAFFVLLFRLFSYFFIPSNLKIAPKDRVAVKGCLESQPKYDRGKQVFYLSELKISTDSETVYNYGDCLEVEGVVDSYTYKQREYLFLENPEIKIEKKSAQRLFYALKNTTAKIQEKASLVFSSWLPEPEASLVSGIVLGAKSKLPKDFYEKLRTTGTLHIVVASGYNLTVISQQPVDKLAWVLGRKGALFFGWLLVWGYALISGGEPPVVRAAIIISLIYLAQFAGRKFAVWRALAVSAWLMLVISPQLITSISFQLSVAAMLGLISFKDKLKGLRKIPLVGKEVADSLSAQVMVLPIIGYHFGQVSWAAPLVNMFVLPLIPMIMTYGLIGLLGLVWLPLAIPFVYLCYPLCWFFVWFIQKTGQYSWLNFSFSFPWWLVLVYYLGVYLFLVRNREGKKDEKAD